MAGHGSPGWARSIVCGLALVLAGGCATRQTDKARASAVAEYSFAITCDMRQFTAPDYPGPRYFDGACAALREVGEGAFMVIPGDFDPPERTRATRIANASSSGNAESPPPSAGVANPI